MANPQQLVDAYLGQGWYAEWLKMDEQTALEKVRFELGKARLNIPVISPIYDRIQADIKILERVSSDYERGIDFIVQGRRVAKDKVRLVHDLYTLALGVVESENGVLDAMFVTGFAAAWVLFPFLALESRSKQFLKMMKELTKVLHEAEEEARDAKIKTAIHGAIVVFECLFPELGLTARAAIFLGETAVNKVWGPSKPSRAQRAEAIATPGVKQFSEAVHHIHEYGETARAAAKKAGHVATAATFYFDYKELGETSEAVEKIERVLKQAKSAYDTLRKLIDESQPQLRLFQVAYKRWLSAIEDVRLTAANVRDARRTDMAKAGYDPKSAYAW
jgi:hypothetical protein